MNLTLMQKELAGHLVKYLRLHHASLIAIQSPLPMHVAMLEMGKHSEEISIKNFVQLKSTTK